VLRPKEGSKMNNVKLVALHKVKQLLEVVGWNIIRQGNVILTNKHPLLSREKKILKKRGMTHVASSHRVLIKQRHYLWRLWSRIGIFMSEAKTAQEFYAFNKLKSENPTRQDKLWI
jgi:hypothetical protein